MLFFTTYSAKSSSKLKILNSWESLLPAIKNSKGKGVKNVKVTLKVKGKTYNAKTNSKGKATFKIKRANINQPLNSRPMITTLKALKK